MSTGTVSLGQLDAAGLSQSATPGAADALTGREATLRSSATVCLAGIPLAQAVALPSLLAQGWQYAVLAVAALALCCTMTPALVIAPASASRRVWRAVAATAALVLIGWAASHAIALPGFADARGDWTALPGVACGVLAAACLLLAAAALRPRRSALRGLATALAVALTLAPGIGILLAAVGPGPTGGETALTAAVHVHDHATAPEPDIVVRRTASGDHYVTIVATTPRAPLVGAALVLAAGACFLVGAVGYLRRRSAPAGRGIEGLA